MISILHILCKDNANREENEMNLFISYPEMKLILCKDSNSFSIHALYIRKVFFFTLFKFRLGILSFKKSFFGHFTITPSPTTLKVPVYRGSEV